MNGGGNQYALAVLIGALEDDRVYPISLALVQKVIFPSVGCQSEFVHAEKLAHRIRIGAGGVQYGLCAEFALGCRYGKGAVLLLTDGGSRCLQHQFHAVTYGNLRQRQRQLPGRDDAGRGGVQRAHHRIGQIGLHLANLFPREQTEAGNAVLHTPVVQLTNVLQILVREGKDVAAHPLERNVQPTAQILHHTVAFHVQSCHLRARMRIVSGVNDGGICFRRAVRHVVALFQNGDGDVVLRKRVGTGGADYAAAENNNVFHKNPPNGKNERICHTQSLNKYFTS